MEEEDEDKLMQENLILEKQSISIFRIYCHLFEGIDWLFAFLAIIGSIGAGIAMPLMPYLTSDVFSDVGDTSESRDSVQDITAI